MTAQELINFLTKHPECEVILSGDAEGNDYSAFDGQPSIMYVEKSYMGGRLDPDDIVDEQSIYAEMEDEDQEQDQDGIDPLENFKPVVVLFPV